MSYFTPGQIRAAIAQHKTIFFDAKLNPLQPEEGQWFCEFWIHDGLDGEFVRDEAMVEFVGWDRPMVWSGDVSKFVELSPQPRVFPEHGDEDRDPRGDILVRQA